LLCNGLKSVVNEVGLFFVEAITSEVFLFIQIDSLREPLLLQAVEFHLEVLQLFSFFIGLLDESEQEFDFVGLELFVVADLFLLNFFVFVY
jgi:hypothetical protein